jgi:hypothetical protein
MAFSTPPRGQKEKEGKKRLGAKKHKYLTYFCEIKHFSNAE